MAEIFLHSLHVVTVLQGEHSEGVAQIMHAGVRRACFGCDLLVMCIKALRVQMVTEHVCENEPTGGVLLLKSTQSQVKPVASASRSPVKRITFKMSP